MSAANAAGSTYKFECPCGAKIETQTPAAATRHREIAEIQRCPSCGRLWFIGWDYEIVDDREGGGR